MTEPAKFHLTITLPDSTATEVEVLHAHETIGEAKKRVSQGKLGIPASQQVWMVVEQSINSDEIQEAVDDDVTLEECGLATGGEIYCVIEGNLLFTDGGVYEQFDREFEEHGSHRQTQELLNAWWEELGGDDEAVQAYTAALYSLKLKAGILAPAGELDSSSSSGSVGIVDSELQAEYFRQCRRVGRLVSLFASFQTAEMLFQEVLVEAEKDAAMTFDLPAPGADSRKGGNENAKRHKKNQWSKESSYWAGVLLASSHFITV
jgi:hypothetical protein